VYKYLHGIYSVGSFELLPLHESSSLSTRGHTLKLAKRSSRTQLRQNFFSNRVVNLWNNLPEEVVMAPSVNCFKGRFDRYYADNRSVWVGEQEDRSTGILPNVPSDDDDD